MEFALDEMLEELGGASAPFGGEGDDIVEVRGGVAQAQGSELTDMPAQETLERLVEGEAGVAGAGPGEHEHEAREPARGGADADRAEVAPVDLRLLAGDEDGQFALTLLSPDSSALTLMVGNAGFPLNHAPVRFASEKLSQMQLQNLQIGQPRQARPAAGFRQAVEFDVSYSRRGVAYRGVAKVSVSPAYDSSTMALTAALAPADQWAGYATWPPQVADQISATNGGAFGMRGIMQQNLQNSAAFGEAARQYRFRIRMGRASRWRCR